jgi:hypothetical protein
VRIDLPLPSSVAARMDPWCNAREKYGAVCYALVRPPADAAEHRGWVRRAFLALLDLAMEERRLVPKKGGGGLGTLRAEGREVELVLMAVRLDGELGELGRRVEGLVRGGQGAGLG